jgi:hypothetical protein
MKGRTPPRATIFFSSSSIFPSLDRTMLNSSFTCASWSRHPCLSWLSQQCRKVMHTSFTCCAPILKQARSHPYVSYRSLGDHAASRGTKPKRSVSMHPNTRMPKASPCSKHSTLSRTEPGAPRYENT